MPRSYQHISNYEKEILELKLQGLTRKETGAWGRPQKNYEIPEEMKINELKYIISEYINFCNNYRIQIKTKLTPLEKRNQFVA